MHLYKNIYIIIYFQVSNSYKKFLRPSNIERDQIFKFRCDQIMERFNNLNVNQNDENDDCIIVETPKKTTVSKLVSL